MQDFIQKYKIQRYRSSYTTEAVFNNHSSIYKVKAERRFRVLDREATNLSDKRLACSRKEWQRLLS